MSSETHPPGAPPAPPGPSGPPTGPGRKVTPLDPDSPAGRAAAESLSQALAEIQVAIWQRRARKEQVA